MENLLLESRVDSLETVLEQFIVTTNSSLNRLSQEMKDFKNEMADFKDEMADFKDEMADFKDGMKGFSARVENDIQESRKDRKEMNKKWSDLALKMGTFAEDIVLPNIPRIAREYFNCGPIEAVYPRADITSKLDKSKVKEFDCLVICSDKIIVNETKTTPRNNYILEFREFLDNEIWEFLPEYKDREVIPIFSSLNIPENMVKFLTKNRIYGLAMGEDTMELLNFDQI